MKITSCVKMLPIEFSEAQMRGIQDKQTSMWAVITIEDRIPSSHPLRGVKELADQRLVALSRVFNRMYSPVGTAVYRSRADSQIAAAHRAVFGQKRAAVLRAIEL
jgi:hypothetical protein